MPEITNHQPQSLYDLPVDKFVKGCIDKLSSNQKVFHLIDFERKVRSLSHDQSLTLLEKFKDQIQDVTVASGAPIELNLRICYALLFEKAGSPTNFPKAVDHQRLVDYVKQDINNLILSKFRF